MNSNFNDLPWHDANIELICIDRSSPGENDIITFSIIWPDDESSSIIKFYDCYALTVNMNLGVVATETILYAECVLQSENLKKIQNKWLKAGLNLEALKHFKFETNSTGSLIEIYSLGFQILEK